MKQLTPNPDSLAEFLNQLGTKRPPILRARPRVMAAYDWYRRRAPELGAAAPCKLSKAEGECFLNAYKGSPSIDRLRARLMEEVPLCPYCGISRPDTLDHYIPKASFPEFAVYPNNLIPCCGACNRQRGDRWRDGTRRLYIHAYFDRISDVPLLQAEFRMQNGAPDVAFRVGAGGGRFRTLYVRHVRALNLLELFRRSAGRHIEEWKLKYKDKGYGKSVGPAQVQQELRRDAEAAGEANGVNHWRAALVRAAAESKDFLQWLCT